MAIERDFTNESINRLRMYGGANGNKISIIYQGENYMLKFPPKPTRNPDMSYANSCFSEYVACHVFETLGIPTQKTLLGTYGDKITVACKDFEVDGYILKDFAQLKNTIIDSMQNGYATELTDLLRAIEEQQIVSPVKLEAYFWDMFVADAFLGNFDRHNGNWGFLINDTLGKVEIAPVYDCGSCLYPQMNESRMKYVLENRDEIEQRLFVFPNSALQLEGKKINYAEFLMVTENEGCLDALKRIGNRIDLDTINAVIEDTTYISDLHKQFLKTMIQERKEKIIDKALERISHS